MGLTTKELEDLAASSSRFYIEYYPENKYEDAGWICIDRTTGQTVGGDGGEPEDQLLVRDWYWVVQALNALNQEWQGKTGSLKEMERRCEAEHEPAYEHLPAPWASAGDKTLADCVKGMAEELCRLREEHPALKQMIVDLTGKVFELEAKLAGSPPEEAEMMRNVVTESLGKDLVKE